MAKTAAKKSKNNNEKTGKSALSKVPAKTSAEPNHAARTATRPDQAPVKTSAAKPKAAVAKRKAKGAAANASVDTKAKPARGKTPQTTVLAAAKDVLASVAVTAKDALNLAVASTIARTAEKTQRVAPAAAKPARVMLEEGQPAPNFKLPRDGGQTVSLSDLAGRKVVLFFYPRADTPGCTREAIDFTRLAGDFEAADTALLGVSADPVKAQNAFRDKHQLSVALLSDEAHQMLTAYGVWGQKSMYGRLFDGILRTTVLIGRDGKIARIWRSVSVNGHADEVLAAAKAL